MDIPDLSPSEDLFASLPDFIFPAPELTGRLRVAFQPLVHAASGELFGSEALVRIQDDTSGALLGPADVFAAGVSSSQASLIVLALSLGQRARQPQAGCVSVNLTADLFTSSVVRQWVHSRLAELRLSPDCLMVELLETDPLDPEVAAANFRSWSDLGVRTAVDDFPAGFATPDLVRASRPQVLKVDREVLSLPDAHSTIFSALELAASAGSVVLVEGVESAEQMDLLRDLGVPLAQGFFISRPLPSLDQTVAAWPHARRVIRPAALRRPAAPAPARSCP